MADITRKLATIVALDVAGYSARIEADEARTTAEIAALRKLIDGIAVEHGGRIFNTAGDGFMLDFGSSLAAVEAAFHLAEACVPKVRIGVHLGDVVVQPNGDLLGHGVNVAARLMAKSDPGSALVSSAVRQSVRGPVVDRLISRGMIHLDKMAETIEAFALKSAASTMAAPDVFVSYAREDQAAARRIAEALQNSGLAVWWDAALRTGDTYDETMERALKAARAVVVLWSKASVESRWVRSEATLADRNRTLVPAMIAPCERPVIFELTQTADLIHWHGDANDPAWLAFVADVKEKLRKDEKPDITPQRDEAKPAQRNNLKAGRSELFGRADDIEAICTALSMNRLVTIAGPGGVGKSSLAHAVGLKVQADFPDGVWWVDLAPITDSTLIAGAIARAIGLSLRTGLADLVGQIADRNMVLIFDNCEHLITAVAETVDAIMQGCEQARVLATSQERLRCPLEHTYRLQPLATPSASAERKGGDAIDLFVARARAVSPGFVMGPANVETVAHICRQLDGLPLAIELAAARVPLLGLDGLRQRLENRFRVLGTASRNAPSRQRTLRSALEWSHALLTASEQRLFARLGVFAGWFDLEALEQVGSDATIESWETADLAASLIDKSLLTLDPEGQPRYRLLETPRAFAVEQLAQADDARAVHIRHAAFMRSRLVQAQEAQWTPRASAVIARVVEDLPNLRAALHWAAGSDGDAELLIALTGMSALIWSHASAESEGLGWCKIAMPLLDGTTQPLLEADLLLAFASLSHLADATREVAALERASAIFAAQFQRQRQFIALAALAKKNVWRRNLEGAQSAINTAEALFEAGWPAALRISLLQAKTYLLELQDRPAEGEPFMVEVLAIARASGDAAQIDRAMIDLAESYMVQGKFAQAAELRQSVHDRTRGKAVDPHNLGNLAATYTQMGKLDEALACVRTALPGLKRSIKINHFLDHFGLLACKRGRLAEGAHLISLSDSYYQASGFGREVTEARARAQADELLRARFEGAQLFQLFDDGRRLNVFDAIDAALAD